MAKMELNFSCIPYGFWNDINNQRKYMVWLGGKLGYEKDKMEDWYNLNIKIIENNYGRTLCKKYKTLHKLLQSIFPEYDWLEWKMTKAPHGFWDDIKNQKRYMEWLKKQLGFTDMEDWYKLQQKDLVNNYGTTLLQKYSGSPFKILKSLFLNYTWLEWKMSIAPNGFWDDIKNKKRYIEWLRIDLGYEKEKMEDWYNINRDILENNYGTTLLQKYSGSPFQLLQSVFPTYDWLEWKMTNAPNGFWDDIKNQKKYMEWLKKQLGFTDMEDWYKLQQKHLEDHYGTGLLNKYSSSPFQILKSLFLDFNWLEWKMTNAPNGFWDNIENQTKYMMWLGKELGYERYEDWYKLKSSDFKNRYGNTLILRKYDGSPLQLLRSVFPNYKWMGWKMANTPLGFWDDIQNQKEYMEWLGDQLGYEEMEDWYSINCILLENHYGVTILSKYSGSPFKILKSSFPNYTWLEWKMTVAPNGFWNEINNHKKYIEWLGKELSFTDMEDWYQLTYEICCNNYGASLIHTKYKCSCYDLIKTIFPSYEWVKSRFRNSSSKGERDCMRIMQYYLGGDKCDFYSYDNQGQIRLIDDRKFTLDGYHKPSNTIIEYHGCYYHGCTSCYPGSETSVRMLKTLEKKHLHESLGYNYIEIWECDFLRKQCVIKSIRR